MSGRLFARRFAGFGAAVCRLALAALTAQALAFAAEEGSAAPGKNAVSLRWVSSAGERHRTTVIVGGLPEETVEALRGSRSSWTLADWQRLLSVFAEQGSLVNDVGLPPMAGSYRLTNDGIEFEPRFALMPGVKYRAVLRTEHLPAAEARHGSADTLSAIFELPRPAAVSTTVVTRVFPSGPTLPENLLKFYLHFSAPMSRGNIYEHLSLQDSEGNTVELPFLEIDEELWDPTMTRLTLFIDPGRIKRGVRPLEEVGPALEEGKSYTLIIDRAWRDAAGNPLKESYHHRFQVGPPDRDPPDPAQWKIEPPRANTLRPLTIQFPEPMDHALALRIIRVVDGDGKLVSGEAALSDRERRWDFTPSSPWRGGSYGLVVETTLEDLAGNSIGRPFEVDLFEKVQRRVTAETVRLPFEIP